MTDTSKSTLRLIGDLLWHLVGLEWEILRPAVLTLLWALPLALLGTVSGHVLGVAWACLYGIIVAMTIPTHLGIFSDAIRVAFRRSPRVIPRLQRNAAAVEEARRIVPLWVRLLMDGVAFANPLWLTSLLSMTYVRKRQKGIVANDEGDQGHQPLGHRTAATIYYEVRRREEAVEAMTGGHGALVG